MDFRKQAKESRTKKLHQLTVSAPDSKVDSSDFVPYPDPDMDKKTGLRPKNPRAFKRGGKVTALEGGKAKKRGDRMGAKGRKGKQVGGGSGASDEDRAALTKMAEESLRQNLRKDEPKAQNTPLPPRRPEAKPEFRAKTDLSSPYKKGGRTKKMMGGDITAGGNPQIPSAKGQTSLLRKAVGLDYKKGGKVKKMNGGPMMAGPAQTLMKRKTPMNNPAAKAPMVMPMRAKGGKVSEMEWEHSKEDLAQDKKLAKKHGMSLEKWEKSAADKKHDKQQSTKGLCWGGRAKKKGGGGMRSERTQQAIADRKAIDSIEKDEPLNTKRYLYQKSGETGKQTGYDSFGEDEMRRGGRTKRASGGRAKGKSNINIVIAPQPAAPAGMPPMGMPPRPMMPPPPMPAPGGAPGGMPPGAMGGAMPIPVPMPMGAGAGMPPAPQGAGVPGLPGMAPLPRKTGGRVKSYKDMTAGAGSGEGRLQKEEMAEYKRVGRKAGGSVPNMTAGAGSGPGRIEKIHAYGENPHGEAAPKPQKRKIV